MPDFRRRGTRFALALLPAAASLLLACPFAPATAARADVLGDTTRTLSTKYRDAVVTLTLVVRVSGEGQNSDLEFNISGCVIDPSGLVVTTDSAIDLASMMSALMPEQAQKLTSKVISAKIVTVGGDTYPAQVVLRDSDRNIAFIRPITPSPKPAAFIDLATAGTAQIGDPVFFMSQLGKAGNRSLAVTEYRLVSVIEHPRTLYVPGTESPSVAGNPAFNEQGAPLGLVSMRFAPVKAGSESPFSSRSDNLLMVVVPAADIADEVKQALAAKVPVATPTAPTAPAKAAPASSPAKKPRP